MTKRLKSVLYKVVRADTNQVLFVDTDLPNAKYEYKSLSKRFRDFAVLSDGSLTVIADDATLTTPPRLKLIKVITEVLIDK